MDTQVIQSINSLFDKFLNLSKKSREAGNGLGYPSSSAESMNNIGMERALDREVNDTFRGAFRGQAEIRPPRDINGLEKYAQQTEHVTQALQKSYERSNQDFLTHLEPTFEKVYGLQANDAMDFMDTLIQSEDTNQVLRDHFIEKTPTGRFEDIRGKKTAALIATQKKITSIKRGLSRKNVNIEDPAGARIFALEVFKKAPEVFGDVRGKTREFQTLGKHLFTHHDAERKQVLETLKTFDLRKDSDLVKIIAHSAADHTAAKAGELQAVAIRDAVDTTKRIELLERLRDIQQGVEAIALGDTKTNQRIQQNQEFSQTRQAAPTPIQNHLTRTPQNMHILATPIGERTDPTAYAKTGLNKAMEQWNNKDWAKKVKRNKKDLSEGLTSLRSDLKNAVKEGTVFTVKDSIIEEYGQEAYNAVLAHAVFDASASGDALPGGDRAEEIVSQTPEGKTHKHFERLSGAKNYLPPMLLDDAFNAVAKNEFGIYVDQTSLATITQELLTDKFPDEKLRDHTMAINIEPSSLGNNAFFNVGDDSVQGTLVNELETLAQKGNAEHLIIEVTERGDVDFDRLKALATFRDSLHQTTGSTFQIAVDDANVVEANLTQLAALRPDMLKTDVDLPFKGATDDQVKERLDKLLSLGQMTNCTGTAFVVEKVPEKSGGSDIPVADILIANGIGAQGFDVMDRVRGSERNKITADPNYYDREKVQDRLDSWLEKTQNSNPELAGHVVQMLPDCYRPESQRKVVQMSR